MKPVLKKARMMPTALFFPVLLRLAGPLAFVLSTIVAGILNRSFILVLCMTVAATVTTVLIRRISPSPAMDLKAVLSPDAAPNPPSIYRGVGRRFAIGLIAYSMVFGLAALVAAVFKTTEFEPKLMLSDIWFLAVPAIIAVIGAWVSARVGLTQMAGLMDQMQSAFSEMQAQQSGADAGDEAFTVEGEVIDPESRDS
jgi:hypothetical protein